MELNTTDVIFIDGLFDKLSNLFVTAAKHTFGTMKPEYRNTRKHTQCKPWFTKECKSAKRNYQKAKRLFKKYGSSIFKNHLTKTESSYKKTPDKSLRTYRINMKNKLKRLRTSNPKDYWNILNSNRHSNDNKNTIDINSLFDYFKQLNSNGDENGEYKLEDILPNMDSTNDELNSPITGEEIKRCIIKMNTNKSPGNDCIINEYITSTIDIVLPIYVTLFNIIFDIYSLARRKCNPHILKER